MSYACAHPQVAAPPGLHQQVNKELLGNFWFALARAKHPEVFSDALALINEVQTLDQLFDRYLEDITWEDFWRVFPYELR